jgi:hypothetical protein
MGLYGVWLGQGTCATIWHLLLCKTGVQLSHKFWFGSWSLGFLFFAANFFCRLTFVHILHFLKFENWHIHNQQFFKKIK